MPKDYKIATHPNDLEGTSLHRREFVNLLKGGGVLVLGSSLAGCASNNESDGDDGGADGDLNPPEQLVIGVADTPDVLDPHRTIQSSSSRVMALLYDPLIVMDGDRNFHPALGKEFKQSDDGLGWTIELNIDENIKFHNGKDLTADDVVFTYNRLLEKSPAAWTAQSLQKAEKIDRKTVKFSFKKPYAFWQSHTSSRSYFGIIPKDLSGKSVKEFGLNPIGTGPYKMGKWIKGQQLTLIRNDDWNTPTYPAVKADDPPLPREIVWQNIPQPTTRIQAFLNGDVDVLVRVPPRKLSEMKNSDEARVSSSLSGSINYLSMHNHMAPTNDVQVRKAIAHAINKTRIIEDIYYGSGKVNYSPMPMTYPAWAGKTVREQVGYVYDPDRAKQILSKAGWKDTGGDYRTKNGKTLSLSMVTANSPAATLQTSKEIAAMLEDVGIKVDISTALPNQAIVKMTKGNTNIMYGGLGWFTADVMKFMLASENAGVSNMSFLKDKKTDEYLERAATTLNDKKRKKIYKKMQLRVMNLCALVPIMSPFRRIVLSSKFNGFHYIQGSAGNTWVDIRVAK